MSIDVTIEGDPSGVFELATWLDNKVSVPSNDLQQRLKKTSAESIEFWKGRSGEGFRDSTDAIAAAADPVDVYAADAATVFRAYARRIERGRLTFADYLDEAATARLLVNGNLIDMPEAPKTYIAAPGAPNPYAVGPNGECVDVMTGDEYAEAGRVFQRIGEKVEAWWIDLEDWIIDHMLPLIARATDFDALSAAFETLKKGNEAIRGFPVALSGAVWAENLTVFEQRLKEAQVARDSLAERRRSGNRAVRIPAQATDAAKLRAEADALAEQVRFMKTGKLFLGAGGGAIEIVAASIEIANGGSWTSVSIGAVGALSGGIVSGVALGSLSVALPPVGIAVVIGAAGYAVGELSKFGWERLVPLDVREAVDALDFDYLVGERIVR